MKKKKELFFFDGEFNSLLSGKWSPKNKLSVIESVKGMEGAIGMDMDNQTPVTKEELLKLIKAGIFKRGHLDLWLSSNVISKAEYAELAQNCPVDIGGQNMDMSKIIDQVKKGMLSKDTLKANFLDAGVITESDYTEILKAFEDKTELNRMEKIEKGIEAIAAKIMPSKEEKVEPVTKAEPVAKVELTPEQIAKVELTPEQVSEISLKAVKAGNEQLTTVLDEKFGIIADAQKALSDSLVDTNKKVEAMGKQSGQSPVVSMGDARILDDASIVFPAYKGMVGDMCVKNSVEPGMPLAESLQKAITTGSFTYGMRTSDVPKFFYALGDETSLWNQYDTLNMDSETVSLTSLTHTGRIGQGKADTVLGDNMTAMSTSDAQLAQLVIGNGKFAKVQISDRAQAGTIANSQFLSEFLRKTSIKLGNELEEATLIGDTTGATGDFRDEFNGIITRARAGANPAGYHDTATLDAAMDQTFPGYDASEQLDWKLNRMRRNLNNSIDFLRVNRAGNVWVVPYETSIDIDNHFRTYGNDKEKSLVSAGQLDVMARHKIHVSNFISFSGTPSVAWAALIYPKNFIRGYYLGRTWKIQTEQKLPQHINVYFTLYMDWKPLYVEGINVTDNIQTV